MDIVEIFLSGLNIGPLTAVSVFLDFWYDTYILFALLTLLAVPLFREKRKLAILGIASLLVIATVLALKSYVPVDRPCKSLPAKVQCENEFSFPSGHTSVAFMFVAASIGEVFFPIYFFLGVLVAFSRLYLGVHWFNDVLAGVVVGIVCYSLAERLFYFLVNFCENNLKRLLHGQNRTV